MELRATMPTVVHENVFVLRFVLASVLVSVKFLIIRHRIVRMLLL